MPIDTGSDEARERMARRSGAAPSRLARDSAPVREARRLVRSGLKGALATLEAATGYPYASLVAVATDPAGHPLLLLSSLALHARNLAADVRASLLIDATSPTGDPLAGGRVTLVGRMRPAPEPLARARFLARHPEAAGYADFTDFSVQRLSVERGHFVGGFGRIVDIPSPLLLAEPAAAAAIGAAEAHLLGEIGSLASPIAAKLGAEGSGWRIAGVDPEGLDLVCGERVLRATFAAEADGAAAALAAARLLAG